VCNFSATYTCHKLSNEYAHFTYRLSWGTPNSVVCANPLPLPPISTAEFAPLLSPHLFVFPPLPPLLRCTAVTIKWQDCSCQMFELMKSWFGMDVTECQSIDSVQYLKAYSMWTACIFMSCYWYNFGAGCLNILRSVTGANISSVFPFVQYLTRK